MSVCWLDGWLIVRSVGYNFLKKIHLHVPIGSLVITLNRQANQETRVLIFFHNILLFRSMILT